MPLCLNVDISHHGHLSRLLSQVVLIDANRMYPNLRSRKVQIRLLQGLEAVVANGSRSAIDRDHLSGWRGAAYV